MLSAVRRDVHLSHVLLSLFAIYHFGIQLHFDRLQNHTKQNKTKLKENKISKNFVSILSHSILLCIWCNIERENINEFVSDPAAVNEIYLIICIESIAMNALKWLAINLRMSLFDINKNIENRLSSLSNARRPL